MNTFHCACLLFLAAMLASTFTVEAAVDISTPKEQPMTLLELLREVRQAESRWQCGSCEIVRWQLPLHQPTSTVQVQHFHQTGDLFREHFLFRESSHQAWELLIRQWDGRQLTEIRPERTVEIHEQVVPEMPPSLPFGPVLRELGYTGRSLTSFLTEAALPASQLRVTVTRNQEGRILVSRRERIAGGSLWKSIDLELESGGGPLLLSAGRSFESSEADENVSSVSTITHHDLEVQRLQFEIACSPAPNQLGNGRDYYEEIPALIRVTMEQLENDVDIEQLRVREITGGPTIRTFRNRELQTTEQFYPAKQTAKRSWPAYVRWLAINDVFLVAVIAVIVVRRLRSPRRSLRD